MSMTTNKIFEVAARHEGALPTTTLIVGIDCDESATVSRLVTATFSGYHNDSVQQAQGNVHLQAPAMHLSQQPMNVRLGLAQFRDLIAAYQEWSGELLPETDHELADAAFGLAQTLGKFIDLLDLETNPPPLPANLHYALDHLNTILIDRGVMTCAQPQEVTSC